MSIAGSSSTSGTNSSSGANSAASALNTGTSAQSVQSEYQTFLTMLTTELQNQDPTQPLDSSQFTSQLAQFSSLEQQLQTNQYLNTLVTNQQGNQFSSAIGYVGHTVEATGNGFTLDDSGDGATLSFSLAGNAASAQINILNAAGATVNTLTMSNPTAGLNTFDFDGTTSSGQQLAAGNYTFSVNAVGSDGTAVGSTTFESGKVTGVDQLTGATMLDINGVEVPLSDVVQVTS